MWNIYAKHAISSKLNFRIFFKPNVRKNKKNVQKKLLKNMWNKANNMQKTVNKYAEIKQKYANNM